MVQQFQQFHFTTGPCSLPDVGELSYNGCVFSPLFTSTVSGNVIKDDASRTTKFMEYTITVDGYVTCDLNINASITNMRKLLTAQGGILIYKGRGFDLAVNTPQGGISDVAWGPDPEVLEFQPLGSALSAKVVWRVKVRIPEITPLKRLGGGILGQGIGNLPGLPLLQFNYDTNIKYGEDGYSTIDVRGVIEVPLTRTPSQATRTLKLTVDSVRDIIDTRIMNGIDLARFHITSRNFNISRDKRTLEFNITAEEKPYMDIPDYCTVARGTYNVRPANSGMGFVQWLCTLRATYTVRGDIPRRAAWLLFLRLLRLRMAYSSAYKDSIPRTKNGKQEVDKPSAASKFLKNVSQGTKLLITGLRYHLGDKEAMKKLATEVHNEIKEANKDIRIPFLMDFNFDEGLYLDSKVTTFSATWRITSMLSHILLTSGVWSKLHEKNKSGDNLWAIRMRDISGSRSWLPNKIDPDKDIIVDFGS